jgi:hypothetical protein
VTHVGNVIALLIAVVVFAYVAYAMLRPEKL